MKRQSFLKRYSFLFSSVCCFTFRLRADQEAMPEEDPKKYVKKKKKPRKSELVILIYDLISDL